MKYIVFFIVYIIVVLPFIIVMSVISIPLALIIFLGDCIINDLIPFCRRRRSAGVKGA